MLYIVFCETGKRNVRSNCYITNLCSLPSSFLAQKGMSQMPFNRLTTSSNTFYPMRSGYTNSAQHENNE